MWWVKSLKTHVCTHSVVESGFEFTLAGRGGGDIHGGLTTTKNDEVLLGCHTSSVEGSVGDIGFEDGEVAGGQELDVISGDCLVERSAKKEHTLADLSFDAVMKDRRSGAN